MNKLISLKSLSSIQRADVELSLSWKKQSFILLHEALLNKDESALVKAVRWSNFGWHNSIGSYEGLSKCLPIIKDWLVKCGCSGKFAFEDISSRLLSCDEEFGENCFCWASKICHILNPGYNSLVYDCRTKKYMGASDLDEWLEKLKTFRLEQKEYLSGLPREEAYQVDSVIWASHCCLS